MAKVTIQSMARELGLSRNTVSMALKGNPLVTEKTQRRVLRCAVEMGYLEEMPETPGAGAPGREYHIMVLRKTDEAVYWDRVMNGIVEEASRNNCQVHVAVVTPAEEAACVFPPGLNAQIDAVIFLKMLDFEYVCRVKEDGHLVFLLDDYFGAARAPVGDIVRVNGTDGVMQLTDHLLAQGMRRIAFVNENSTVYETMHDRYTGYLNAMQKAGIEPEPDLVLPDLQSDHFYFERTFDEIVKKFSTLPEAAVCGNDMIAKNLTEAFLRRGIRVPEDVAVTGFDNDEVDKIAPFFSTVQIDARWLGRRLVQSFLWRLDNPDAPYEKVLVYGEPVFRTSSVRMAGRQEEDA